MVDRARCRNLLRLWGDTTRYCADQHKRLEEYESLIASATDVKTQKITGMPGGGQVSNETAIRAEKLMDMKSRYEAMVDTIWDNICRRLSIAHSIEETFDELTPEERRVVSLKYEHRLGMKKIGQIMSYGVDNINVLEAKAVDKIREWIAVE